MMRYPHESLSDEELASRLAARGFTPTVIRSVVETREDMVEEIAIALRENE